MSGTVEGLAREVVGFDPHVIFEGLDEEMEYDPDDISESMELDDDFYRDWEELQNEWSEFLTE